MRVGNFSLLIPEGRERESGHIELAHKTVYRIKLMNHCYRRHCDALVTVDGKEIGLYRINRGGSITLERSAHDSGCFTFFKADSQEGVDSGVAGLIKEVRGLIQVSFKPEKIPEYRKPDPAVGVISTFYDGAIEKTCGMFPPSFGSARSTSKGGAGGQSCGRTGHVSPAYPEMELCSAGDVSKGAEAGVTGLTGRSNQTFYEVPNLDYDPSEEVKISVRLVCCAEVRPLTPITKSNPVPAAL